MVFPPVPFNNCLAIASALVDGVVVAASCCIEVASFVSRVKYSVNFPFNKALNPVVFWLNCGMSRFSSISSSSLFRLLLGLMIDEMAEYAVVKEDDGTTFVEPINISQVWK